MGRMITYIFLPAMLGLLFFLLGIHRLPDWEGAEALPLQCRFQVEKELQQAARLLEDAGTDTDAAEQCLIKAGISTLDTDAVYPEYLANGEALAEFWNAACDGEDGQASLLRVNKDGSLRHLLFRHESGETWFYATEAVWSEGERLELRETAMLPVYDMELADWGIFYYRCYPEGDPHYVDYSQIRMHPADREAYDLVQTYILPVGYQMVNLFLCDWQEGEWGELSFPDLLEFLYGKYAGRQLLWEQYPGSTSCVWIPAELFESTLLPFFQIHLETFRERCGYDGETDSYPWRPVHGNDLTAWRYPMCEPEVVSWQENGDGTLTLVVQVFSPELKTDRLFIHEVTVRPLETGFQYVANRITYVSDRGLPPAMPRFALGD